MRKPQGYDEASIYNPSWEPIKLGGHRLVILKAIEDSTDGGYEFLRIVFDMAEDDEQPNYYQAKLDADKERFDKPYYGGQFMLFMPNGDPESDMYKSNLRQLKAFITSVEESNPGFTFDWDETKLANKKVGGCFGLEEYINKENELKEVAKLRWFCSIGKVEEQTIPKLKQHKNRDSAIKPNQETKADDVSLPFEL